MRERERERIDGVWVYWGGERWGRKCVVNGKIG